MDLFDLLLTMGSLFIFLGPPLVVIGIFLYYRHDYRRHHKLDFEDKRLISFCGYLSTKPFFIRVLISYLIYRAPNIYQSMTQPSLEGIPLSTIPVTYFAMFLSFLINATLAIRRVRYLTGSELKKKIVILLAFMSIIPFINYAGLIILGFQKKKDIVEP